MPDTNDVLALAYAQTAWGNLEWQHVAPDTYQTLVGGRMLLVARVKGELCFGVFGYWRGEGQERRVLGKADGSMPGVRKLFEAVEEKYSPESELGFLCHDLQTVRPIVGQAGQVQVGQAGQVVIPIDETRR